MTESGTSYQPSAHEAPRNEHKLLISEYMVGSERIFRSESSLGRLNPDRLKDLREQHYYNDYVFSFHMSESSLKQLGITETEYRKDPDAALRLAMANEQTISFVNNHGWGAGKEMWEIDAEGESFTSGQIRQATDMQRPSVILNLDSNGWGKSTLTKEGMDILKKGPEAMNHEQTMAWLQTELDQAIEQGDTDLRIKTLQDLIRNVGTLDTDTRSYADFSRDTENKYFREIMPGSASHAAHAIHSLMDEELNVQGYVVITGHSQGGKIANQYMNMFGQKLGKRMAFGLAADETGRPLKKEANQWLFFQMLAALDSKIGKPLTAIGDKLRLTGLGGKLLTTHVATADLPPKLRNAVNTIHGRQVHKDSIIFLNSQARHWQLPEDRHDDDAAPNPLVHHYRGRQDRLTPNEPFSLWYKNALSAWETRRIDRFLSMPQLQYLDVFEGGHYGFLHPTQQGLVTESMFRIIKDRIQVDETGMLQQFDYLCERRPDVMQNLRLAVVDEQTLQTIPGSCLDRLSRGYFDALSQLDEGNQRPEIPVVIPVSAGEMMAFYQHLTSDILATHKTLDRKDNREIPDITKVGTRSRMANFIDGTTFRRDRDIAEKVRVRNFGTHRPILVGHLTHFHEKFLINRSDAFPLGLYAQGILPIERLQEDLNQFFEPFSASVMSGYDEGTTQQWYEKANLIQRKMQEFAARNFTKRQSPQTT